MSTPSWETDFKELFCEAYTKHISGQDKEKCYNQALKLLNLHIEKSIKTIPDDRLVGEVINRYVQGSGDFYKEVFKSLWIPINTPPTSDPEKTNEGPHIHCWCVVERRVIHLAWNPYYCCWDNEDEDDVSEFSKEVAYWQPIYIPETSNV